jgi:hypothetical protein
MLLLAKQKKTKRSNSLSSRFDIPWSERSTPWQDGRQPIGRHPKVSQGQEKENGIEVKA